MPKSARPVRVLRRARWLPIALLLPLSVKSIPADVVVLDPDSAPPPGLISTRLLPRQPLSRVLDEGGTLSAEALAELTETLARAAEKGVAIHAVILKDKPSVETNALGTELVQRWTGTGADIDALVLAVPPASEEPTIFIRSRLTQEAGTSLFDVLGRNALDRATWHGSSGSRVYGATLELATGLEVARAHILKARDARPGMAATDASPEAPEASRPTPPQRPEQVVSRFDLFLAAVDPRVKKGLRHVAVGLGALAALGFLVLLQCSRRPRLFPQVDFRRRFSAPYSGGNNAHASFSRARFDSPSRAR